MSNNDAPPFGGIFTGLSGIVCKGYGLAITQHFLGAVGGFFVGSLLGYIFEHILFRVSPKTAYLNTLPRQCRSLKHYQAISYTVRSGQLCSKDMFRVLDVNLRPWGSCSFGKFEKVVKKTADSRTGNNGAAASEE